MAYNQNKESNVILRDIHCPYCDKDSALLISEKTKSTIGFRLPAFGLRFVLSIIYLSILHIWIHGYKIFEATKERVYSTYGFCPSCGNSYSARPPEDMATVSDEPKLYRVRNGKAITGYCKGIAEFTGIPVLWIRIMTVLFGLTLIGTFFYFLISVCIPFREDVESGAIENKRYRRAKKGQGRVIMGICKGISNYTEISVAWIRVLMLFIGLTIIGAIAYLIIGKTAKIEDYENVR